MPRTRPISSSALASMLLVSLCLFTGCQAKKPAGENPQLLPITRTVERHPTTVAIDAFDQALADVPRNNDADRLKLYQQRWAAVQSAVVYRGTTHRDAFYGSRAYWHTGSTRGINWTQDQQGDLDAFLSIPRKGNVRVAGDVNDGISIAGNSIIHILGDLNGTLDLTGICEVVIAGSINKDATIICDGQLELYVGGDNNGILGSTKSSTIIIDGNAAGTLQSGAPATTLTIAGDLIGDIPPPKNKDTILTLAVDGYCPTEKMLDLATAGFTRVNATLGISNAPAGLYPQSQTATRRTARWVVLQQRAESD